MDVSMAAPRPYAPEELAARFCRPGQTVVVVGPTGRGKSTLVAAMADATVGGGERVVGLSCDPGRPAFGPAGAVARAVRTHDQWRVEGIEGLATLDAVRFRLPLVGAVARLRRGLGIDDACLLVDTPGVWRGLGSRELLRGLIDAVGAHTVLMLVGEGDAGAAVGRAVGLSGARVVAVSAPSEASSGTRSRRVATRTDAWDAYLAEARSISVPASVGLTGAPPPLAVRAAWPGRQVGLVDARGVTLAMGEVDAFDGDRFEVRAPLAKDAAPVATLVARDARRDDAGALRTDRHRAAPRHLVGKDAAVHLAPAFTRRRRPEIEIDPGGSMSARLDLAQVTVVGGLFDDPAVYARTRHGKRGILFDLGAVDQVPTGLLHKVSDCFVSHAHFDHFVGFVELLRRRVHMTDVCRVWGPLGVADKVEAMGRAFTWDRIGAGEGPVFVVGEFDGESLRRTRIEPAIGAREALGVEPVVDGVLLREPRFQVRACALEHGTMVLAYALEETHRFALRSDRLDGRYSPGRWLGELRERAARGERDALVELPDGSTQSVGELADYLLIERPGERIVYATDFADTPDNRARVVALARGAKVLICEASFRRQDAALADYARHLTTRACAEIARDAQVERLVPFHFSSRYEREPEAVYEEILEIFDEVIVPEDIARRF